MILHFADTPLNGNCGVSLLAHSSCLADKVVDRLSETQHSHLLQAGATLPIFFAKTTVRHKISLATSADKAPGLPM